jgi:hypothetical protein
MKKLILSIAAALTLGGAMAQSNVQIMPEQKNLVNTGKVYVKSGNTLVEKKVTNRNGDYSGWYQFTRAYEQGPLLGQSLSTYVSWIYPDTTANTVSSTGAKNRIGFHVVGSTLDPKDTNFMVNGNEVLTKFQPYTLDSIFFTQSYIRFLDSTWVGDEYREVVDTAYIQYFDITGMDINTFVFTTQVPRVTYYYGIPKAANFRVKDLKNSAALKTDTIFLTKALKDSIVLNGANSSVYLRGIQIPVGLTSKATNTTPIYNNMMAFTISFAPMVKTSLGDTLVAYDGSIPTKKYNLYGVRLAFLENHDQLIKSPYQINNFFVTNFEVRYGATVSIFKSYLPGTIFGNSIFMPNAFKITTANLKKNEVASSINNALVYPNPASTGTDITISYTQSELAPVTAYVTDLNGRVVKNLGSRVGAIGENVFSASVEGLSHGMYILHLNSTAGSTTSKFTIQ